MLKAELIAMLQQVPDDKEIIMWNEFKGESCPFSLVASKKWEEVIEQGKTYLRESKEVACYTLHPHKFTMEEIEEQNRSFIQQIKRLCDERQV